MSLRDRFRLRSAVAESEWNTRSVYDAMNSDICRAPFYHLPRHLSVTPRPWALERVESA